MYIYMCKCLYTSVTDAAGGTVVCSLSQATSHQEKLCRSGKK